jgi:myo-inositol-1(or 4)-monophosphatase
MKQNQHTIEHYETMMHIVKDAGRLLMGCFGRPIQLLEGQGEKERSGYTTTGDVYSLNHLVQGIRARFPEDGIIAEGLDEKEFVKLARIDLQLDDGKYVGKSGFYWVIDPLCGTIMHERGIRDFAISVGLVDEDLTTHFGCVYDPSHTEMFYATLNGGSFMDDGKRMLPITVSDIDGKNLKKEALVSIEHGLIKKEEGVIPITGNIKRLRTAGTCGLELSYVGAGRLEAVLKGKQPLYDYAGGLIIVKEAGGMTTDFEGNDLTRKLNYEKCTDMIVSNGRVHEQLLEYTKKFKGALREVA